MTVLTTVILCKFVNEQIFFRGNLKFIYHKIVPIGTQIASDNNRQSSLSILPTIDK